MAPFDFTDPGMDAYGFVEAVADERGDEGADAYLAEFVEEVMTLHPGIKEGFVDTILDELIEEVARREDSRFSHATIELVKQIQTDWRNDS